jgi:hypothetical protein
MPIDITEPNGDHEPTRLSDGFTVNDNELLMSALLNLWNLGHSQPLLKGSFFYIVTCRQLEAYAMRQDKAIFKATKSAWEAQHS